MLKYFWYLFIVISFCNSCVENDKELVEKVEYEVYSNGITKLYEVINSKIQDSTNEYLIGTTSTGNSFRFNPTFYDGCNSKNIRDVDFTKSEMDSIQSLLPIGLKSIKIWKDVYITSFLDDLSNYREVGCEFIRVMDTVEFKKIHSEYVVFSLYNVIGKDTVLPRRLIKLDDFTYLRIGELNKADVKFYCE